MTGSKKPVTFYVVLIADKKDGKKDGKSERQECPKPEEKEQWRASKQEPRDKIVVPDPA